MTDEARNCPFVYASGKNAKAKSLAGSFMAERSSIPEHTAYMSSKEFEIFASKIGWTNPPVGEAENREKAQRAAKVA